MVLLLLAISNKHSNEHLTEAGILSFVRRDGKYRVVQYKLQIYKAYIKVQT